MLFVFGLLTNCAGAEDPTTIERWPYYSEVPLADAAEGKYQDFILTPEVFDAVRTDLGDLRLYDAAGNEVPYALRIRRATHRDEALPAREFNRTPGADNSAELTLDLNEQPVEHNAIDVQTAGDSFRRRARVEGSADNKTWRKIVEADLFSLQDDSGSPRQRRRLTYPPSRFRYLRIRVEADPEVDNENVQIVQATVFHKVEVPGEFVTRPVTVGEREPTRAPGGPGSAWVLDLGGRNQPVESVEVTIGDPEYARDYTLEYLLPDEGFDRAWSWITTGTWQRRAGEPERRQLASFPDQNIVTDRLRLVVTDHRNPPLKIKTVAQTAAVRQVIFARSAELRGPLRLYYGNQRAEPPHYDLERNLPRELKPAAARVELGPRADNPGFVPEPKPLTERLPWLIYVVLGGASAVLAVVIFKLGNKAIAIHDEAEATATASPAPHGRGPG